VASELPKLAVFLHGGDYDRVHQGLSIAAAATASGRRVEIFWFWWALERLLKDDLDEPTFSPPREDVTDTFEKRGIPTLRELLGHLKASGLARSYACSGSVAIVGADREKLEKSVDQLVGWSTILQLTAGVTDRFYL
jgi:peroxiredoxin family protein